jgi:methionine synthase II (cobalamin-independent)
MEIIEYNKHIFVKDSTMSEHLTSHKEIKIPLPETTHQFRDFFRLKATTDPEYEGYDKCADMVANAIEDVVQASKAEKTTVVDIALAPDRLASQGLYRSEMSEPPAALMELALHLTHASLKAESDSDTGHKFLWQGRYDGQPVNFVETISDEANPKVALTIGTRVPKKLLPKPSAKLQTPFVTRGEKKETWLKTMDELDELPTIREPKQVKRYIRQQKRQRRAA